MGCSLLLPLVIIPVEYGMLSNTSAYPLWMNILYVAITVPFHLAVITSLLSLGTIHAVYGVWRMPYPAKKRMCHSSSQSGDILVV
mmetsp:Transcript_16521/g.41754  ORF Transcript_16521/g.41754 Transcript_16521/m.41754 type:complete len:85 (-) Transcript_16521:18-272(-)